MLVRRYIPGQCIGEGGVDKMPQGSRFEPGHRQRCMALAGGEWIAAVYCRQPGEFQGGFYARSDDGWSPIDGVTHWRQLAPPPGRRLCLRLPLYIPEPYGAMP